MDGYQLVIESINQPPNLINLKKYPFVLDLSTVKYFNPKNPNILLNKKAADALLKSQQELPKGYKFIISSGYRGYKEQYVINEYMKKKLKKQYPNDWEKQLKIYTGGDDYLEYIKNTPYNKISHMAHASGKAVDIVGILDNNKKLNLGDQTNSIKDRIDYYKSGVIARNRKLLKTVLINNGFENYKHEWWHWGYYE